jgi:lipid-A-disaccharide synthase-like uncharacterized protein
VSAAPPKKRLKWEPAALMALVLGLGLWIAFGPASRPDLPTREGALLQEIRIGEERGVLEAVPVPGGDYRFRVLLRNSTSAEMDRDQAEQIFGARVVSQTIEPRSNWLFRQMNITSWVGVVWLGIGLLGQIAFSGRMVLQWITSERRRQSIITESFWWFSLAGSVLLFSYFAWRQEPIGLLGQASGLVIYSRNLRLIYKQRRRDARATIMDDPVPEPSLEIQTKPPQAASAAAPR